MAESWWAGLSDAVDQAVPAVAADVLDALRMIGQHVPRPTLAGLVVDDPPAGADFLQEQVTTHASLAMFRALWRSLPSLVWRAAFAVQRSLFAAARLSAPPLEGEEGWLATYLRARVEGLVATTRDAIPGIVTRALQSKSRARDQLDEMVGLVGLTESQARTVATYRQGLEESDTPPLQRSRLVLQRAAVLMSQRATTIADSELQAAVNAGAQHEVAFAVDAGVPGAHDLRRYWVVQRAAVPPVCQYCAAIPALNRGGVALDEPFVAANGVVAVMAPPLHPHCRCVLDFR